MLISCARMIVSTRPRHERCACVSTCESAVLYCGAPVPSTGAEEPSSAEPVAKRWPSVRSRCGIAAHFLSLRAFLCVCECVPMRRAHRTHHIKVRESRGKETVFCL